MIHTGRRAAFLILLLAMGLSMTVACTNILVTRGATQDGSTMITYAADSHTRYGQLYFRPAADHPEGTMLDVYDYGSGVWLGKVRQARHTFSVVGFTNEHQVSMGETTFGGRPELVDTAGIIDYGSLMFMALQRSRTAREAIRTIGSLVAEYGYRSSGESFSIADPKEVWIMELIGKGSGNKGAVWVAMRIPDGTISGHANHPRITTFPMKDTMNCYYAPDVISSPGTRGTSRGRIRSSVSPTRTHRSISLLPGSVRPGSGPYSIGSTLRWVPTSITQRERTCRSACPSGSSLTGNSAFTISWNSCVTTTAVRTSI